MDVLMAEVLAAREDPSRVVLEGFHAVKHALRFGARVRPLVSNDRTALLELARSLAPDLMDRLADSTIQIEESAWRELGTGGLPTPALGVAPRPEASVRPAGGPLVLLEDPRHLGNLGACVRVAAAAGAVGVLTTGAADPWHPSAVRAAAGLHFALHVERVEVTDVTGPVVAVDPQGAPLGAASLPADPVFAFGTERDGLSRQLLDRAVGRVAIPMRAGVSSLNLATAVAVVLYHHRGTAR